MMKLIVDENLLSFKVLEQKVCDKCSLPVPLDSSNSVEKLCDSWVQTRGYLACVVGMPIPLRVCLARAPTKHKLFLINYGT